MKSMSTMPQHNRSKSIMITDLDASDTNQQQPIQAEEAHRKAYKRRTAERKVLHTISGGISRRSRSVECRHLEGQDNEKFQRHSKLNSYFNDLTKDKQMDQLLQRLGTLHKFNEQFSEENGKLRSDIRVLEQRIAQLQRQIDECDNCQALSEQLATLEERNKFCETDVEMMKTLVYRLNVQIEHYQDQIRLRGGEENEPASENRPTSVRPWDGPLRAHTLTPLLKSYDEMIADKEDLIKQYRQDFEYFTGELKRVLEENNRLLQENESHRQDSGSWRGERTRLQAQLDVCRTKAEAQTRKSDLAKEKLIEVMHCYEQKMQTVALDMDHLQSAYARCKNELASLKSLTGQPHQNIEQSLQECKELLEQLKQQHNKEKHSLERDIAELRDCNFHLEAKIEKLKNENNNLKKTLDQREADASESNKRCASLERQTDRIKHSRDRLKARLRIALQWAQKLEDGQANIQGTWDALKRLETIVKHKESQVRGLHERHLQEIDKMQRKLNQKEETIRKILKGKLQVGETGEANILR